MKLQRYSIILLTALSFVGCSKVEELNSNPDSALQIESVGGVSQYALMQAQPASKAVIDGNTLPGSEADQGIGIFVTAQDGSAYIGKTSGYSNVKYTYNGEKWSTTTPIYLSGNTGKLYGYFPYNAGATDFTKIPIASSLNGTDYLYAEQNEVSISEKSVSLQMNHALARLHLTLKKGEKYKADGVISGITLKSTAIDATGTMDIATGEVTATKAKTDKGVVELAASGSLSTGDQTYDILLVSADASDAATPFDIFISIDGTTAGVSLSGENGITVQSGKQYDVTLEIQDSGIKVTGVGVGEWGEGGSQTVQVNGHTVTVKLSDDVTPHDILTDIYADGNAVKIEACSKSGKIPVCDITGDGICTKTNANNIYAFTISNIVSDVTVTLRCMHDGVLTGVFTISKDGGTTKNHIYFSKGNLWADSSKALHFETNQREVKDTYDINHISHFTWSSTVAAAVGNSNSGDYLFCDENHKVSVDGSDKIYYALSIEEWYYLFNKRTMNYVDFRYTLNITYGGKQGLVLYPDDYVGAELSGSFETLPEDVVFLPFTGRRNSDTIYEGGVAGYYVSSSTGTQDNIYRVVFKSDSVDIMSQVSRHDGSAVRLVAGY